MVGWLTDRWLERQGVDVLSPSHSGLEQFAARLAYWAMRLSHPHWRMRYRVETPAEPQSGVIGLIGIGHGSEGEARFGDRSPGGARDVTPGGLPAAYPDLRWMKLWACYQGRHLQAWAAVHARPVVVRSRRGRCFGPFPWPPERRSARPPGHGEP